MDAQVTDIVKTDSLVDICRVYSFSAVKLSHAAIS